MNFFKKLVCKYIGHEPTSVRIDQQGTPLYRGPCSRCGFKNWGEKKERKDKFDIDKLIFERLRKL